MGDPTGEADSGALRLDFDRRLLLRFRCSTITSDAGLLAYRELDDTRSLTDRAADTLADARTGKNGRHRQECDQMDPAVMPDLRRQCCPPPAPCAGLQPRQLHADAGNAKGGGAVVADQPSRETDQDRRQGCSPRALRQVPAGRGRGVAADVRGHPVTDRPAARTTRARMRSQRHQMRQATTAEVCLDAVGAARFSAAAWSTGGFEGLLRATSAVAHCSSRSKGRSWPRTRRTSGECRLNTPRPNCFDAREG